MHIYLIPCVTDGCYFLISGMNDYAIWMRVYMFVIGRGWNWHNFFRFRSNFGRIEPYLYRWLYGDDRRYQRIY